MFNGPTVYLESAVFSAVEAEFVPWSSFMMEECRPLRNDAPLNITNSRHRHIAHIHKHSVPWVYHLLPSENIFIVTQTCVCYSENNKYTLQYPQRPADGGSETLEKRLLSDEDAKQSVLRMR